MGDSADDLSKILAELRGVAGAFGKEGGSFQKLVGDPAVYQNLDAAAGSLARIMARSEKIARDLEVFADKVARRPELIGIGGALQGQRGAEGTARRAELPPGLAAGVGRATLPRLQLAPAAGAGVQTVGRAHLSLNSTLQPEGLGQLSPGLRRWCFPG